ncbi:hypothetical protein HPB49_000424 [Dermacentor silvarum]|uniref:Uncharacterized protein n=1 Tax=Dermacentor silvarum TaxID=543639 RepID=A0ACB8CUA2_DERSI|nr:hypothetical protein HPB49_000424 [Dermacentor silvarum]
MRPGSVAAQSLTSKQPKMRPRPGASPYAITVNIDIVMDGLVNAAVRSLAYTDLDESGLSKRLWLRFDCANTGRGARLKAATLRTILGSAVRPEWAPIKQHTVTTTFDLEVVITCRRTQCPMVQAIVKYQSISLRVARILALFTNTTNAPPPPPPQKLAYVPLSRPTSLDGLYIINAEDDFTF